MKKIVLLLMGCILLTGCGKYSKKDLIKDLEHKMNRMNGYSIKGDLTIHNNDEKYEYDVEVLHKKDDNYKVVLTNKANNHTQIILKNKDGVYILTPSLNKSFKFQSNWPYNNSQVYLINTLIEDIKRDKNTAFKEKNNHYYFDTKVNYPNNTKIVKQKIVFNKNLKPESVSVYDKNGIEVMSMIFDKVSYPKNISLKEFDIDNIIEEPKRNEETQKTSSLEDVIYPLFLPAGTKLVDEERINKTNGERVIMTYDGEKSFTLVEETVDVFNEFMIIPSLGEPYQLMDTLGVMTNNSLSWSSGNIEFYLVSDVMSQDEMVEVAQSITGIVSMK